ncbi:type I restriction enzyme M protein [Paenibacillus castaneae]|uniref:type I restriction-modification system subunit M n=1 Tax=Paenibacillus castaneae TaxID=474957 RepID=UPI00141BE93E|nr:class I SAM-dependent DNA methyltransferase [Paenibacillus castaneae]NIK80536.1 type I restriction enzyme M protein [Paenibacillus castaneae]
MAPKADITFTKDLFDAANRMRGSVAPSEYKHYVLPLIFLRYVSLRYEKRRQELEQLLSNPQSDMYFEDEELRLEMLDDPDQYTSERVYVLPEDARWSYIVEQAKQPNIKEILDKSMRLVEEKNPDLQGVLPRNIYQASNLPAENISELVTIFSRDVFSGSGSNAVDVLGRVYEYFIGNFASSEGNRGGEFFTPASIVQLLVAMLEPKEGTVFDPACGSGGMFIQSEEYAPSKHSLSFYGQENVDLTLRLGKMNVLMHGMNAEIRLGNSLLNDQYEGQKFNYVIANPPFNLKEWGADRLPKDDPRLVIEYDKAVTNGNANYFWLQHFLYHLKDGGTAGTVMANGAMTTTTTGEKEVRQAFVDQGYIDCIVQLPEKLFFTTGIPCCLFFLSKNRKARKEKILFIDARKKGSLVSSKQKALSEEEINEIAAVYHAFKMQDGRYENIAGFCKEASLDEVRGNDYKLTPGIYVGTQAAEVDDVPFEEKMAELMATLQEQFVESNRLQERIQRNLEGIV